MKSKDFKSFFVSEYGMQILVIIIIQMIEPNNKELSKMLILSNKPDNTALLQTILGSYFEFTSQNTLYLTTKYYKTSIQIATQNWPTISQTNSNQNQAQIQPKEADKQDLLIMLVGQQESFQPEIYDYTITKYNPDNFILIVNMSCKDNKWKDEEIIATQVNNFIQVIKENLHELNKNPPKREKSGLLADNFQQGSVFSLLELIQTTQWSRIERFQEPKKIKKQEPVTTQSQKQQTAPSATIQSEQQKQQKPIQTQLEKQMTQQQLQQQMASFQSMMRDMLSIKQMSGQPQGVADNERKVKAEELINRLLKGNFM